MTRTEKIENFVAELDKQIDIDLAYYVDCENVDSYDSMYECIDAGSGFDVDIIYYSKAIEYLAEHDPSLHECMSIASELCYDPSNLNSELLASLLASQNARSEFADLEGEIDEFFEELSEDEDVECPHCLETYLESSFENDICPNCGEDINSEPEN